MLENSLDLSACNQCGSDVNSETQFDLPDFIQSEDNEPFCSIIDEQPPSSKRFSSDIFFSKPLTTPSTNSHSNITTNSLSNNSNNGLHSSLSLCSLSVTASNSIPTLASSAVSTAQQSLSPYYLFSNSNNRTSVNNSISPTATSNSAQSASNVLPGK